MAPWAKAAEARLAAAARLRILVLEERMSADVIATLSIIAII